MKCLAKAIIIRARPPSFSSPYHLVSSSIIIRSNSILQNNQSINQLLSTSSLSQTINHHHHPATYICRNSLVLSTISTTIYPQPPTIFRNGRLRQHVFSRAAPFSAASLPWSPTQPAPASSAQVWLNDWQSQHYCSDSATATPSHRIQDIELKKKTHKNQDKLKKNLQPLSHMDARIS